MALRERVLLAKVGGGFRENEKRLSDSRHAFIDSIRHRLVFCHSLVLFTPGDSLFAVLCRVIRRNRGALNRSRTRFRTRSGKSRMGFALILRRLVRLHRRRRRTRLIARNLRRAFGVNRNGPSRKTLASRYRPRPNRRRRRVRVRRQHPVHDHHVTRHRPNRRKRRRRPHQRFRMGVMFRG